jgi:hypothetical protein
MGRVRMWRDLGRLGSVFSEGGCVKVVVVTDPHQHWARVNPYSKANLELRRETPAFLDVSHCNVRIQTCVYREFIRCDGEG